MQTQYSNEPLNIPELHVSRSLIGGTIVMNGTVVRYIYRCSAYLHQANVPAIPAIPVYARIMILPSFKEPVL